MTDPNKVSISTNGGSRPIPDPTSLTDRAIERAMESMRDWTEGQIAVLTQRLVGMDAAAELRLQRIDHIPARIDEKVLGLKELVNEKFESAERQRVEQKLDTKQAVDAALSAAKEAVREQTTASERSIAKSEGATTKQLEQQQATFTTAVDGLRRSNDDLKERMAEDNRQLRQAIADVATTANSSIQQKLGAKEDRTGLYAAGGAIGVLLTIGAIVFATRPT